MILGIDFGTSRTKMVLTDGEKIIRKLSGDNSSNNYLDMLKDFHDINIDKIAICGAGSSYIDSDIDNIPTTKVEEFTANIKGALSLTGLDNCMVVSLGSGSSFIHVNNAKSTHVGGSGMGGALLNTLYKLKFPELSFKEFLDLADKGDMNRVDLLIKDISKTNIGDLYADVTAANLGKLKADSSLEDYAAGVCNLVFQNVGVMTYLSSRGCNTNRAIMLGTLSNTPIARKCINLVGDLYNFEFVFLEEAEYATSFGAALSI